MSDIVDRLNDSLSAGYSELRKEAAAEITRLRAKIEVMKGYPPYVAIGKILTEVMDIAAANGADSRSMPDEYVEVAAWLCGIPPVQPTPSIPEGWKLVPIEPTETMISEGCVQQCWKYMLEAAPEAKPNAD